MGNEDALEYYFGRSENDEGETFANRPGLLPGVEAESIDTSGSPDAFITNDEGEQIPNPNYNPNYGETIDNSINPSNWNVDEENFFLDANGERMPAFIKNLQYETGYEPFSNENTQTIFGNVENTVKEFHTTAENWSVLPNGQVVVKGYGENPDDYRPFRDIKDYSFRHKDFLKAPVPPNHFAEMAESYWGITKGSQGKITEDYLTKLNKYVENGLMYSKNEKGVPTPNHVNGQGIRKKLALELAEQYGFMPHVTKALESDSMTLEAAGVILDGDLETKIRNQFSLDKDTPITFHQYASVVASDRMQNFLIKHKGMKEEGKIYWGNTRWDVPRNANGQFDLNKSLPINVLDTREGSETEGQVIQQNWITGQQIRFDGNDEPTTSMRIKNNMPVYFTSEAGAIDPRAFSGLNLRMTRTGITPVMTDILGSPLTTDRIDSYRNNPEWNFMMDVRIDTSELIKAADNAESTGDFDTKEFLLQLLSEADNKGQRYVSALIPLFDGSAWTKDPFSVRTDIISNEELNGFIGTAGWRQGKRLSGK
tara:strand:- start:234 stop:1850 length:1617 start_codon:yes stop_codon:yes gene_type:complete